MTRNNKIRCAKFATILATIPVLIYASAFGPPPRHTGAPGDQTCAAAGCHVGTGVNPSGGNVQITYSGGSSYVPGERGRFTVTISDQAQRLFGFQATARLGSNLQSGQAGTLHAGTNQAVVCEDDRTLPCTDARPVQFVRHNQPNNSGTFEFEWTPPAAGAGEVRIYVAGNAANGNGQNTGDRIYTANITLTPAQAGGERPTISQRGVTDAFNFQEGVAQNAWLAIFGANLSTETRTWDGAPEFNQQRLPTTLAGVSVTVNGRPAAVYSVSPTQVNALAPLDDATGDVQIMLRNANGESTPVTARKSSLMPGLYAPFAQESRLFVTARWNDNANVILGKPGVEPRAERAFRPGDIVQFYANGLGPTNPATPESQFISSPLALAGQPQIRIGETPVEVLGAALVGSGLYQVNGRIPEVPNGDHPIVVEIGGARSASNVYISIQR